MSEFGPFRIVTNRASCAKKFSWLAVAIPLIPMAFLTGMRVQVARERGPTPPTITLDCRMDGSIGLNMGGTVVDGDHIFEALNRAAKTICARKNT